MNNDHLMSCAATEITENILGYIDSKIKTLTEEGNLSQEYIYLIVHAALLQVVISQIKVSVIENELECEKYIKTLSGHFLSSLNCLREQIIAHKGEIL